MTKSTKKCQLCDRPTVARGLCRGHYESNKRKGSLEQFGKSEKRTLRERLMAKVAFDSSGCWLWTGHLNRAGYPMIWKDGKAVRAHREMYKIFNGDLPDDLVACHKCDTPSCVNPEHLFAGTRHENNVDSVKKLRNAFGERNGWATLSKEQVLEIKRDTRRQWQIAADFGISQPHVSKIKSGIARPKVNME